MFSFATSNSGWLRRYLLDSLQQLHAQTHPSGVSEPSGLEDLHGLLHRTAKQNGLLMGCPVLEESRYRQLETFRFPEKSGDALMVYLDTLIEVGLSFFESFITFPGKAFPQNRSSGNPEERTRSIPTDTAFHPLPSAPEPLPVS